MKNQVLTANELTEAEKWIKENQEELKASDITEDSLVNDISDYMRAVETTNDFTLRPKGSPLKDLINYLKDIQKDFDRIDTQATKTIARAIDTALDKVEDYPYSIKDIAIKRYMQILGLNYYFVLDFEKDSVQDYNAIFAADVPDVQADMEKNRARYTQPSIIAKCAADKARNCAFKNIEFNEDEFNKQTTEYYELCESLLESMHIEVPRHTLLLPFIVENVLRENMEAIKASQVKDTFYHQQLGEGEEVEPEYETTSGAIKVPRKDAEKFWEMRRERSFGEFNICKIIPVKNINLNEKRYNLLKDLTEQLAEKISSSKDYKKEDFLKLYLI